MTTDSEPGRLTRLTTKEPERRRPLGRILDGLYRLVEEPDDTDQRRLQKSVLLLAAVIGAPMTMLSAVAGAAVGSPPLAVGILATYAVAIAGFVVYFVWTKRGLVVGFNVLMVGNLLVAFYGSVSRGGVVQSGASVLWGLIPAVLALLLFGRAQALSWFSAYLGLLVASLFVGAEGPSADGQVKAAFAISLIGVSVFMFVMFLYFTRERDRAQAQVEAERARSDALLLDVLPDEIVGRLKSGETVIADGVDEATVLFADIADFTPMSTAMRPDELVSLLDEVFRAFDRLTVRQGAEKIKTIGDCYMVAAGVPTPREDHADVIAAIALEMQELVASTEFGGHRLRFRIGVNSGPLIAGVIGEQKFLYDLWGDTVNTASRMESHGLSGGIQITEATRRLLGDRYVMRPRGEIEVKGKGPMPVYFLEGRSPDPVG